MRAVDDEDFELIVRQAGREFLGSGQRRQPASPFYHYATPKGASGILETECIWATDYRFLNDREEVERGENAVQAELESVIQEYPEDTCRGFLSRQIEECRRRQSPRRHCNDVCCSLHEGRPEKGNPNEPARNPRRPTRLSGLSKEHR
jgi:hypothetical protein